MDNKLQLTKAGSMLLAAVQNGAKLEITAVQFGSGIWTDEERAGNPPQQLKDKKRTTGVDVDEDYAEGVAAVHGTLSNEGLTKGFRITEVAIIAKHQDPSQGEIVYMIAYTPDANFLPEKAERGLVTFPFKYPVVCGINDNVEIPIKDDFTLATLEEVKKSQQEHNASENAHPNMRVAAPHLTIPNGFVGKVNEGETIGLNVSGVADNAIWSVELRARILNAENEDVTAQFNPQFRDDALMLTAPQVEGDSDFTAQIQTWRHGELASLWSTSVNLTVVDVPVDSPTLTFPANHAVDIGETPTIRWTKGASDDPSKKYADAEVIISRDLLRTVVVAQSGKLGAVTEWTVPSDVLHTNEHLYVSVHTKWGDTWSGWTTQDFFTTDQFQFIQPPKIIAPQQSSEVMWSGLKAVIAKPVVEQGGTLQQDKIEAKYSVNGVEQPVVTVNAAQTYVDIPILARNADIDLQVRTHDRVRGWSGWSEVRAFRTKNIGHGMRVDGGIAIGNQYGQPLVDNGKRYWLVLALQEFFKKNFSSLAQANSYCRTLTFESCSDYSLPKSTETECAAIYSSYRKFWGKYDPDVTTSKNMFFYGCFTDATNITHNEKYLAKYLRMQQVYTHCTSASGGSFYYKDLVAIPCRRIFID